LALDFFNVAPLPIAIEPKEAGKRFLALRNAVALALAIAISLLAGVTGCGSAEESSATSGHPRWIRQADRLCRQATARLEKMPPIHITTYHKVVPAMAQNERALAAGLRALQAPRGDRPSLERLTGVLDRQASEVDAASVAYTHLENAGDYKTYKRHVQRARSLDEAIERDAQSLGAGACTEPPVRTRYL
jgi:hypothetical protein